MASLQQNIHSNQPSPSPSKWKIWWRQLRPHTLTASFIPVLIGSVLAIHETELNLLLLIAMLVSSIMIQAATNMFNEYYDFKRGLDTADSIGIGGGIVRDGISAKVILNVAVSLFATSILLGIYISYASSWWIAAIGALSMAAGYFYTGGPKPIAYTPFGEVTAGLFMGLIIISISYFIQTNHVSLESVLTSIPVSILIGSILTANSIRDLIEDKEIGRKTLAVLLGHDKSVILLGSMFGIAYLSVISAVLFQILSPWLLLVLISIPVAFKAIKQFKGTREPIELMEAMKSTAKLNTIFGLLLIIGLIIDYII